MLQNLLSLPLEKKIGQLFFIGIPGPDFDPQTQKLIKDISPGGICLFARNVRTPENVRKLLDEIRENSQTPPLLSLDQEGGLVDRLRRISTPMPSAKSLQTPEEAQQLARITSELIQILGFNMNFAPVVDVINDERRGFSNGLYSRTFGNSLEDVLDFAGNYLEVLQKNGCLGTIKHFPGMGAADLDPHEDFPQIKISEDTFLAMDLVPFKNLIELTKVQAVMVAHTSYPNLHLQEKDEKDRLLPATLSFNFVTKLLREKLGFEGITITDDMEMGAIINNYGIGSACQKAILAGIDMLAICAGVDSIYAGYETVLEAVKKGDISEERINQSLKRIANTKSKISQPINFDLQRIQELSEEISKLNQKVKYQYGG